MPKNSDKDVTDVNELTLGQHVRFLNASQMGGIDFYMFSCLQFAKSNPGEYSIMQKSPHGICTFKLCNHNTNEICSSAFFNFEPESSHIICAVGDSEEIGLYAVEEKPKKIMSSYAHVKICMLNQKISLSDVSANKQNILCHIKPLDVSRYIAFLPGTYSFKIKKSGTGEIYGSLPKCRLNAGESYCLFVCESKDSQGECKVLLI